MRPGVRTRRTTGSCQAAVAAAVVLQAAVSHFIDWILQQASR